MGNDRERVCRNGSSTNRRRRWIQINKGFNSRRLLWCQIIIHLMITSYKLRSLHCTKRSASSSAGCTTIFLLLSRQSHRSLSLSTSADRNDEIPCNASSKKSFFYYTALVFYDRNRAIVLMYGNLLQLHTIRENKIESNSLLAGWWKSKGIAKNFLIHRNNNFTVQHSLGFRFLSKLLCTAVIVVDQVVGSLQRPAKSERKILYPVQRSAISLSYPAQPS